jgi:hypothetical protein
MSESGLPKEVRELVGRRLRSMEEVESLLLLAGEPPGLTVAAIRERLRLAPAADLPPSITALIHQGLVEREESGGEVRYRCCAMDAGLKRAVDLLRVAYNERPVTLVRLVYSRPTAAQSFADAFRIMKDDDR